MARTHRVLGLLLTVPLVGWVLSSFVMHAVGLALPNGLQGEYEIRPYAAADVRLERADLLPPSEILSRVASEGMERVYWIRLQPLAGTAVYVVKPGPFELEHTYDARTGRRLDPLPLDVLTVVADDELVGSHAAGVVEDAEFNRYYRADEVAAARFEMVGTQRTELVLARSSGRTLRRTDPLAAWFDRFYRSVHVWQWGDSLRLFTAILYGLVGLTLVLVGLGYVQWRDRRQARKRWTAAVRPSRRLHARLAPVAGVILATQMLVGAYLWFNLGPIEPRFRGQGSFAAEWSGGIGVAERPADVAIVARALPPHVAGAERPVQAYEWRAIANRRFWVVYPRRNAEGILFDADTGRRMDRLDPDLAREAAEAVVEGRVATGPEESEEYWMDLNLRVPTYLFRFDDEDATDVHVSQITGEVVQRRPAIWRAFGPFLLYHTFGFTGHPVADTILLLLLQATVLAMVVSGWILAAPLRRRRG